MKKIISICLFMAAPTVAETVTYTRLGDTQFGSDGSTIQQFGDTTIVNTPDRSNEKPLGYYQEERMRQHQECFDNQPINPYRKR